MVAVLLIFNLLSSM